MVFVPTDKAGAPAVIPKETDEEKSLKPISEAEAEERCKKAAKKQKVYVDQLVGYHDQPCMEGDNGFVIADDKPLVSWN